MRFDVLEPHASDPVPTALSKEDSAVLTPRGLARVGDGLTSPFTRFGDVSFYLSLRLCSHYRAIKLAGSLELRRVVSERSFLRVVRAHVHGKRHTDLRRPHSPFASLGTGKRV